MPDYRSLSHARWNCKYHIVFITKKRQKVLYGSLRKHLGEIFHELAKRKGCEIVERHLMRDHVRMCLRIPPKYPVSNVVGFIKGKAAIIIARNFKGKQRNFTGENFWARGHFVSNVGLDEDVLREHIRNQEKVEDQGEHMRLNW